MDDDALDERHGGVGSAAPGHERFAASIGGGLPSNQIVIASPHGHHRRFGHSRHEGDRTRFSGGPHSGARTSSPPGGCGNTGEPQVRPDLTRAEVTAAAGIDLAPLVARRDRGEAVTAMTRAAPVLVAGLASAARIQGIISLGGGGGTAIGTAAMRSLPIGFPKLMVSTLASGNTAPYVGARDIVMFPSVVDVAGLNRVSREILARAAGAICGMVEARWPTGEDRPVIVASQFGNTTRCVEHARELLERRLRGAGLRRGGNGRAHPGIAGGIGNGGGGVGHHHDGVGRRTGRGCAERGTAPARSGGACRRAGNRHPRLSGHGQLRAARHGAGKIPGPPVLHAQSAGDLDADDRRGMRGAGSDPFRQAQCLERAGHRAHPVAGYQCHQRTRPAVSRCGCR